MCNQALWLAVLPMRASLWDAEFKERANRRQQWGDVPETEDTHRQGSGCGRFEDAVFRRLR